MAATTLGEPKPKAARCLFGRPEPGHQISQRLNERLNQIYEEDTRRWNFDFNGGVPVVDGQGDYVFESMPAADAPAFYREKTIRSRKAIKRRDSSPVSDTIESPDLLVLDQNEESQLLIASTSKSAEVYEKPVTRSTTAKKDDKKQESDTLKQTKLTNYMPVRKRRSTETPTPTVTRSNSEKRGGAKMNINNKGATKRPLRFVAANLPKLSISDSAISPSPRSPPAKKNAVRRSRRSTAAGDF